MPCNRSEDHPAGCIRHARRVFYEHRTRNPFERWVVLCVLASVLLDEPEAGTGEIAQEIHLVSRQLILYFGEKRKNPPPVADRDSCEWVAGILQMDVYPVCKVHQQVDRHSLCGGISKENWTKKQMGHT